ncbi:MAG TPA: hypothetical protein VL742_00595 [Casimicrobiaceae bacterium]|nr:hypothetical protein [Casimicrobiaceae bacterium]
MPALGRFRSMIACADAAITVAVGDGEFHLTATHEVLAEDFSAAYIGYYHAIDPKNRFLGRDAGKLFNDAAHFDEAFVSRDAFYQEFTIPNGMRHTLDMNIGAALGQDVYFAAMRTARQGPFDRRSEELFQLVSRHVARAVAMRRRIERTQAISAHAAAALDRLGFGIAVLDRRGRVLVRNAFAARLCDGTEGPAWGSDLRAGMAGRILRPLINTVLAGHGAKVASVPREGGGCWAVWIAALPPWNGLAIDAPGGAIVLIGAPQVRRSPKAEDLMILYGLTHSEAELARALVGGATLKEIAGVRHVKLSTVRTQLLSLLGKTGFNRQAQLTRALGCLPGMWLDER